MSKLTRKQVEASPSDESLRDTDLNNLDLSQLNLKGRDLSGARMNEASLSDTDLRSAKLDNSSLIGANLTGAQIGLASLGGALLGRATLRDAELGESNLRGADLASADLAGAQLAGALLNEANLSGAMIQGANLSGTVLDEATLIHANLTNAILTEARVRSADLSRASMEGTDFSGADLTNSSLERSYARAAIFRSASLRGADLRGADLSEADLWHADLRGARYDDQTRWPEGFQPGQVGAVVSEAHEPTIEIAGLRPGKPYPLGATWDGQGVNFSLYSRHAARVELCLFDSPEAARAATRITMPEKTDDIWHVYVPHLTPGQLYAYRVYGRYDPKTGHRFNPNKLLIDPYAKALSGTVRWHDVIHGYRVGHEHADLSFDERNSAEHVPKSVVVDSSFPWDDERPPRTPLHRSVIYELHVKGFTQMLPSIPESMRGTYSALGTPVVIEYLKSIGVTAVELMPVHQHVDDGFLVDRGLSNYWGYNTLSYFAPDARFARQDNRTPGMQVREFKAMVKALHAAGIEVILDVVYNHTAEGNHLGPTLCYRGIDNASYYRLVPGDPRYYMDYTGCGNTLNVLSSRTLQLIMDSLRYWVSEMHVDGFRFDLAAALMRGLHEADRLSAFFDVITQDPVISQVKLIAEPWDVGPGGYQVGNFPVMWSEWNGRYRDTVRRFWKGDESQVAELAYRLSGSSDLYEHNGRRPYASVNFVTAHDGFTLQDLISYNDKHNEANGEGNADGEESNNSWNCGIEGPTDDADVLALRAKQRRNFLSTLLLSQGVPMILAGDERGRTQQGNNNAYCQDNELSWMDWTLDEDRAEVLDLVRKLVAFRKSHPSLQRRRFFHGRRVHGADVRDIVWLKPDGGEMSDRDWSASYVRCIGMLLNGQAMSEWSEHGELARDDALLFILNAHWESVPFAVPSLAGFENWAAVIDTASEQAFAKVPIMAGAQYVVASRSLAVLEAKPSF